MKIIGLEEMISRVIRDRREVVVSVPDYGFFAEFEPKIFGEMCAVKSAMTRLYRSSDEPGKVEYLGYFSIPDSISAENLINIVRFSWVRLFVCSSSIVFLENIPAVIQKSICRLDELDKDVLLAASSMSGFKWMALRDGDEGDAYYYLFEGSVPDPGSTAGSGSNGTYLTRTG